MTDTSGPSLSEERLEILRLVENQTITAEEASRLLEALDRTDRGQATEPIGFMPPLPPGFPFNFEKKSRKRRNVRIRITSTIDHSEQFNLVLPHPLLDTGLKMAKRFAPDSLLEAKEIRESIDEGFEGPLLDIVDNDQRVEIIVENR